MQEVIRHSRSAGARAAAGSDAGGPSKCRGARRGGGRWRGRGGRAGASGARRRWWRRRKPAGPTQLGGGSEAVTGPVFGGIQEGQEGSQERQEIQEEEEKPQEGQEEEEATRVQQQFFQQPVAESQFKQLKQQQRQFQRKAFAVERQGEEQACELRRLVPRRRLEVEEERGSGGICFEASRCADGPLPGRGVRQAVKGHVEQVKPAQGGLGGGLGTPVHRAHGDPRLEGGAHVGGDLGLCESPGDREGHGHLVPKDSCYPGGEDERGQLGESGGHRVGQHPEEPGQHVHAGPDQLLNKLLRRALGPSRSDDVGAHCGFGVFYSEAVAGLAKALGRGYRSCSLGVHVRRLRQVLHEFKRDRGISVRHSPGHVFPLPPFSLGGAVVTDGSAHSPEVCTGLVEGANLVIAVLNDLHRGQDGGGAQPLLSAAHRRVHARIACALEAMVLTDEPLLSSEGLDNYLKQSEHYSGSGVVLALGVKGGVPTKAADVPLEQHLQSTFPEMAEQVIRPNALLLSSRRRPRQVKRGYTWLARSYPELVKRNVKAGLHCLKKPGQVAKHRGAMCLAGAFAVKKDECEDRVITDPSVNQLLDPEKLPRPRFAFIPKMRCLTVPCSGVVAVSKRDARHYFHRLRIGRRWRRWLCGPPVLAGRGAGPAQRRYPASCSAPMGFGPSAGWAQGLTDTVTMRAGLAPEHRLHPDLVVPESLPLWGSIVDDVWAIEHAPNQLEAGVGAAWMDATESSWVRHGVEPNAKKSVDSALGEEVQGYYVDPYGHWVGVSLEKRRHLFQATIHVLRARRVPVGVIDRLVGKHGFVHSARPCLRSIFEHTYGWLTSVRGRRRDLVSIPNVVWVELAMSCLLLPFCSFNLSAPWSTRIECTDSSMTGLGRAWGIAPKHVVQLLARYSDHGQVYTNLKLPWSIGLTTEHKCPLRRVRIPIERIKWHTAGAPWNPAHITLGEADAVTWAAEDRLRRPVDEGCRFVHPLDSAACAGCLSKGRSSSFQLNSRCRRVCAINIAGGHEVFYPWMPSKENPADEPSRRWEPDANKSGGQEWFSLEPRPLSEVDVSQIQLWPRDVYFFLHLCSGPRRDGDLCDCVEKLGALHEINIVALRIDPLAAVGHEGIWVQKTAYGDLLQAQHGLFLLGLIQSGKVLGGFASPPCSTVSRARHAKLMPHIWGPRPLRSRDAVWEPLAHCTVREQRAVYVGSVLFLLSVGLLGEIACQGGWSGLEHPADPGPPYPSFFCSEEVARFCKTFKMQYREVHQCRYGASTKKPTGLLLPKQCATIHQKCNHSHKHAALVGLNPQGRFRTGPAAKYPGQFCEALATNFVERVAAVHRKGYVRPFKPCPVDRTCEARDPWVNLHHVQWDWPQPRAAFLAENLEALHAREVPGGPRAPQQ